MSSAFNPVELPMKQSPDGSFQSPLIQAQANLYGYRTSQYFEVQSSVASAFNSSTFSTIIQITNGAVEIDIPESFVLEFQFTCATGSAGTGTCTQVANFLTQRNVYTDSNFSENILGSEADYLGFLLTNLQETINVQGPLQGIDPVTYLPYFDGSTSARTLVAGNTYTVYLKLQTLLTRTKSFLRALTTPIYFQLYFNNGSDIFTGVTATLNRCRLHIVGWQFIPEISRKYVARMMEKPVIARGIYWKRNILPVGAIAPGGQYTLQVGQSIPNVALGYIGYLRATNAVGSAKYLPSANGQGSSALNNGCFSTLQWQRGGQVIITEFSENFNFLKAFNSGDSFVGQILANYDYLVLPFADRANEALNLGLQLGSTNVTTSDVIQFTSGATVSSVELVNIFLQYCEIMMKNGQLYLYAL